MNERDAKTVINLIDDIGVVNIDSISKINKARESYDSLNQEAKQKVTNYAKLQDMEKTMADVRKTEIERLKETCNISNDEMAGVTWYNTKQQSRSKKFVLPYLGIDNDSAFLRVLFYYSGRTNVGFDSVIVMSDGKKYERKFNALKEKDINIVTGQEWADIYATDTDIAMLKTIADSKDTKVRYTGTSQDEFTVSEQDKQAIKDLLNLYYLMK